MVRVHVEIPATLLDEFTTLYPHYGQLTTFVRSALQKHLLDVGRDTARLLEE